jgi:hypothetical protein
MEDFMHPAIEYKCEEVREIVLEEQGLSLVEPVLACMSRNGLQQRAWQITKQRKAGKRAAVACNPARLCRCADGSGRLGLGRSRGNRRRCFVGRGRPRPARPPGGRIGRCNRLDGGHPFPLGSLISQRGSRCWFRSMADRSRAA